MKEGCRWSGPFKKVALVFQELAIAGVNPPVRIFAFVGHIPNIGRAAAIENRNAHGRASTEDR